MLRILEHGDAIVSLAPEAQWVMEDNDLSKLEWLSEGIERPTDAAIEAELVRLQELREAQELSKAEAKASAHAKLEALGLTQEEVVALIGETNGA